MIKQIIENLCIGPFANDIGHYDIGLSTFDIGPLTRLVSIG